MIIVWASLRVNMFDAVILVAVIVIAIISIFLFITGNAGSKGLTKEYTTKSGVKHTAKKERKDYII